MADNTVEDENEATILAYPDAENISVNDILYLIQGAGSNRDHKMALGALMAWIAGQLESGQTIESLVFSTDHTSFKNVSFINGDGVEICNAENASEEALTEVLVVKLKTEYLQLSKTANSVLRETVQTADGFEFRRGAGNDNTKATISLDLTTNKLQIQVLNGLEIKGAQLEPERLNLGSVKSYFEISEDSNINTLIAGVSEQIAVAKGDIVTLRNNSNTDIEVVMGLRKVTLNAFCAMQFICHGTDGTNSQWAPLGNTTVTLA